MKHLFTFWILIFVTHLTFSQTNSMIDLKPVLEKLKNDNLISSKTELLILEKLDSKISLENRSGLFQQLTQYAEYDLEAFQEDLIKQSENANDESLENEGVDIINIQVPTPNSFGGLWIGLDRNELDEKQQTFKDTLDFFKDLGLLKEEEVKSIKGKIGKKNYYFELTFYKACLDEVK